MVNSRKGEIAYQALKEILMHQGLQIGSGLRERVIREADRLGIAQDEALEFAHNLAQELVAETFATE